MQSEVVRNARHYNDWCVVYCDINLAPEQPRLVAKQVVLFISNPLFQSRAPVLGMTSSDPRGENELVRLADISQKM